MEQRSFNVQIGWYRCACGRFYGCEDGHYAKSCSFCLRTGLERQVSIQEAQTTHLDRELASARRTISALKGVITKLRRY